MTKIKDLIDGGNIQPVDEFVINRSDSDFKVTGATMNKGINNVLMLGVDNTGVSDVSSLLATLLLQYNSLYFPDGTYQVGDLELTNNKLWGSGKFVKVSNAERTLILNSNCTIDGLEFSSTSTGTQRSEIRLNDSASNVGIYNCNFNGSIYSAISADLNGVNDSVLTYTNTAKNIRITNCSFTGYIRPLYLHSVENIVIANNTFKDTIRDAIRLRQNTGMALITGNSFKDIGEDSSSIIERPANWISLDSYSLAERVSVPPFGIYESIVASTTIGANPATSGASEWTLIDGSYFETKDAIDTYWSGKELIISNNIVDGTASVGFDIKGSEPSGLYSTDSVIITGNIIKNTFGIGLNFHSSALLDTGDFSGEFRYVGNCIISNNIFKGCNAEKYDVAQPAINIRQGTSNVSITDNHIKNHHGRGINLLNLDAGSKINRSLKVTGNQVIDCGLAGHSGNIGINISPIDGAIIKDNIVENTDFQPEYKLTVTGTPSGTNTLSIPTKLSRSDISLDLTGLTTSGEVLNGLAADVAGKEFPDDPNPLADIKYYGDVITEQSLASTLIYNELKVTAEQAGVIGDSVQFELVHDNGIATGVFVGAVDVVGSTVTLTVRTSATAGHAIAVFDANKVAAGADTIMSLSIADGAPTDIGSQATTIPTPPLNLTGGFDASSFTFYSRITDTFDNTTFPITVDGVTVDLFKYPNPSNSVNKAGIVIREDELVGSTTFSAGIGKLIIKDNIVRNNASLPRFEILYNGQEISNPLAYVTSNNPNSSTIIVPFTRTPFINGADSGVSTHLNSLANFTFQTIVLQARVAGDIGNTIHVTVEQPVTTDQILRAVIAPVTTVNGYEIGGREIIVFLPTDGVGAAVDVTVAEMETLLRTRLNQSIFIIRDNILE